MGKQIILNAFDMNSAMHNSHGLWKHPESKRHRQYKDLNYWVELAKLLERGKFDAIFFADVLGVYDVYRNSKISFYSGRPSGSFERPYFIGFSNGQCYG